MSATRITLEVDQATAAEMLSCALLRANWYEVRRKPVPRCTLDAIEVLTAAIAPTAVSEREEVTAP